MKKKLNSFKNTEKGVDRSIGICYYNDVGREKVRISERVFVARKIKIQEVPTWILKSSGEEKTEPPTQRQL